MSRVCVIQYELLVIIVMHGIERSEQPQPNTALHRAVAVRVISSTPIVLHYNRRWYQGL